MCSDLISKSPCSLTCGSVLTTCIFPLLQLQYVQWASSRGCKEDGKKGPGRRGNGIMQAEFLSCWIMQK
jgi:hypothetical protein